VEERRQHPREQGFAPAPEHREPRRRVERRRLVVGLPRERGASPREPERRAQRRYVRRRARADVPQTRARPEAVRYDRPEHPVFVGLDVSLAHPLRDPPRELLVREPRDRTHHVALLLLGIELQATKRPLVHSPAEMRAAMRACSAFSHARDG
jgi:hypothetical protein